jgi:hypothetical protein
MLALVIVSVVSIAAVILLYQLLLQKYYWGPKGPPKKSGRDKDPSRK